ncbi:hypothetical protein CYMTET_47161 [Cymbomonas tetramitiformis]|uniref:Uncharacterized protein n=1 Tax=Cymbomonas tetramitiformis TaxID=36881 RepID=A0AAE0EWX0_9CHLO|nr:hypothetical protein CYMTET_47161 [Cymbomonas tetramitiformis]
MNFAGCTTSLPHLRAVGKDEKCCGARCGGVGSISGRPTTVCNTECTQGWARQVFDWINTTWPHQKHRLLNVGTAGGNVYDNLAECLDKYVESGEHDLFIMEGGIITPKAKNIHLKIMEQTLQRILSLPAHGRHQSPPAVIFVNFFNWCQPHPRDANKHVFCANASRFDSKGKPDHGSDWRTLPIAPLSLMRPAFRDRGDVMLSVAKHYSLPVLSLRTLLTPVLKAAHLEGGNVTVSLVNLTSDGFHPNGNKGTRLPAELLIHFLRNFVLQTKWRPLGAMDKREGMGSSSITEFIRETDPSTEEHSELPEPLFPGNVFPLVKVCFLLNVNATQTRTRVQRTSQALWPQLRNVHGFRYTDHEIDGNRVIPKPGFITHRAGSRVDFLLDTSAPGGWEDHQAYVSFEFLRSYMHMGKARLICALDFSFERVQVQDHVNVSWD